jgi:sulfite exporter TauE/SafE
MTNSGASMGGRHKFEGAGGTPGGVGEFLIGILLAAVGCYLLFSHVQVHSSYWNFLGGSGLGSSFGISLLPLLFGVGMLFVNGKSRLGWFLAVGGLLFILAGILMNLDIYFTRTSLMNTLIMLICIAAGFGLIVKSLRPHGKKDDLQT